MKVSNSYRDLSLSRISSLYRSSIITRAWWSLSHWHLKTSIVSCFSQQQFKQIWCAFIIQDSNTSLKESENSWWFKVEFLTSIVCKVCQKYWASEAHLAVNECMILYFEHTWHVIKTSYKSIKQDYKFWTLENHDYIFNWLWHSKVQDTEDLDSRSLWEDKQTSWKLQRKGNNSIES